MPSAKSPFSPEAARKCVERYLACQTTRDWHGALNMLSDEYLDRYFGIFQQACTEDIAKRYGFLDSDSARQSCLRDFVKRMLLSSENDAEGCNPAAHAIPENADCHIKCTGHEVVLTLSTPFACTRTHFTTMPSNSGHWQIVAAQSSHNHHAR